MNSALSPSLSAAQRPLLTVADIMHPHVITVEKHHTVAAAIAQMQTHRVRTLIIHPEDHQDSYGIVTVRDIAYRIIARRINPMSVQVAAIMRSPCITLYPDMDVYQAAQRLAEGRIQRAPVIGFSDYGDDNLLGLVSITDLVMTLDLDALNTLDTAEDHPSGIGLLLDDVL